MTPVAAPPIVLGTMRLPSEPDGGTAADFLVDLAERGLDVHHSSMEYDTFDDYRKALGRARAAGARFRHVVKVAEPSWDSDRFDPDRLARRIDQECDALGVDRIDTMQWLVRTPDPSDVVATMAVIDRDRDRIAETFRTLADSGQVGEILGFPYTRPMAERLIGIAGGDPLVDGLTLYLNPEEQQWRDLAERVPTIAIRPFAGGSTPPDERQAALTEVLAVAGVRAAMVSVSSRRHADELLDWTRRAPDW